MNYTCNVCGARDGEKHKPSCPFSGEHKEQHTKQIMPPEEVRKITQFLEEAGTFSEELMRRNRWLVLTVQLTAGGIHISGRRILSHGAQGVHVKSETQVTWRGLELAESNIVRWSIDEIFQILRRASPDDKPDPMDEYDA